MYVFKMERSILSYLLFLVVCTTSVTSSEDYTTSERYVQWKSYVDQLDKEYPDQELAVGSVEESDIKFYYHNRNASTDGIRVYTDDSDGIVSAGFDADKDTMFIIHGWIDSYTSEICTSIAESALEAEDINVFIVDWNEISGNMLYPIVFTQVPAVGTLIGELIGRLVTNNSLDLDTVTVVGHSLGAHVAGIACANLNSSCSTIVGLDPAGPLFSYSNTENRLNSSDGKFVHVIHTSKFLGFETAIGTADYYPNGGGNEPGCELDLIGICDHFRSYKFYAESLVTGNFTATQCDSYSNYENAECANNTASWMGEYAIDKNVTGSFYLRTNRASPYARGGEL